MTLPISLAAAASIPAIGVVAKGLKQVTDAVPFSFGSKDATAKDLPKEVAASTRGVASENPSLQSRLTKLMNSLHEAMRRSGVNPNAPHEISADGDQLPQVDSDDLEASQFAESWFSEHPEQAAELNSIVRDLRTGPPSDSLPLTRQVDTRRQTLKIVLDSNSIETNWGSDAY